MKKNIFRSLFLGVSFSLLFSIGSFACNAEDNVLEEDIKYLKESVKFKVVTKLGEEFGEFAGCYKLDLENSFEGVKEITEETEVYYLCDNQGVVYYQEEGVMGECFFTTEEVLLTPDKVYKNDEGKVVSLINEKKLYWDKINESDYCAVSNNSKSFIEKIIERGTDTKYEVIAKLGEEFGEFAGYYKLDLASSFDGVKEITEGTAVYGLPDSQVIVSYGEGSGGGTAFLTVGCVPLTPGKLYKNDEGKMISDSGKKLYWDKIEEENGQIIIDRTK